MATTAAVPQQRSMKDVFYTIFCPSHPLTEEECRAVVSREHQRKQVPEVDPTAIDAPWEQLKSTKPKRLFNGLKFRLAAIQNADTDTPLFELGVTDYKTSTGTTRQIQAYTDYVQSKDRVAFDTFEAKRDAVRPYLSNALGVETLTLTSDGYAVLFKRSIHVGELPGYYNGPSGHPEPGGIFNEPHYDARTNGKQDDASRDQVAEWFEMVTSEALVHEMFHSAVMEVHEEVGVALDQCVDVRLICVAEDPRILQPNVCFLVKLSVTKDEVRKVFEAGQAIDAYEAEEGTLHFLDMGALPSPDALEQYLYQHFDGKVCPSAVAALFHGLPHCAKEMSSL